MSEVFLREAPITLTVECIKSEIEINTSNIQYRVIFPLPCLTPVSSPIYPFVRYKVGEWSENDI